MLLKAHKGYPRQYGTPPPRRGGAVGEAEYRELIEKTGSIAVSSTLEELARILAETYEQTSRISREFGLQL